VHEILYKQEGVSLDDIRALDHLDDDLAAGAPGAAEDKADREESARMRHSAMHMAGRQRYVRPPRLPPRRVPLSSALASCSDPFMPAPTRACRPARPERFVMHVLFAEERHA
jgi:hypothetical protein